MSGASSSRSNSIASVTAAASLAYRVFIAGAVLDDDDASGTAASSDRGSSFSQSGGGGGEGRAMARANTAPPSQLASFAPPPMQLPLAPMARGVSTATLLQSRAHLPMPMHVSLPLPMGAGLQPALADRSQSALPAAMAPSASVGRLLPGPIAEVDETSASPPSPALSAAAADAARALTAAVQSLGARLIDAATAGDLAALLAVLAADPCLASAAPLSVANAGVGAGVVAGGASASGPGPGPVPGSAVSSSSYPAVPRLADHQCARTGNSALMLLCSRGRRDCNRDAVAALLGHGGGGALAPNLNARNARDGRTALMLACSFGHMECVRLLLAHGSGNSSSSGRSSSTRLAIDVQDNEGLNALMHCSSSAHVDIARLLLTQTPPPDMTLRSHSGATAIALARSPEMKRYLTFWKGPELLAAAAAGDLASVVALLQTGTDVDFLSPQTGASALLEACAHGRFTCARHILASRPALFVRDRDGLDALHRASAGDHQECAFLLLNVANQRARFEVREPLTPAALALIKAGSAGSGGSASGGSASGSASGSGGAGSGEACMKTACGKSFSLGVWRSACHLCGLILCSSCAPFSHSFTAGADPVPLCEARWSNEAIIAPIMANMLIVTHFQLTLQCFTLSQGK